jgi:hypothetical protein
MALMALDLTLVPHRLLPPLAARSWGKPGGTGGQLG